VKTDHANDITLLPKVLDARVEAHDSDGSLKPLTIKEGMPWTLRRQENLLTPVSSMMLDAFEVEREKEKAMDLLDAISRSGTLAIDASELHVMVGVAHCFDKSIIETVIEDNVNPIAKMERSLLLLASTIYGDEYANNFITDGTLARHRLEESLPSFFLPSKTSHSDDKMVTTQ
jgi:hypothetical protein